MEVWQSGLMRLIRNQVRAKPSAGSNPAASANTLRRTMRNRTAQLILQSAYCALGIVAIFASFGFFDYNYNPNWYVYFTHLSNYMCFGIMLAELIQTAKRNGDGYVSVSPFLKFFGLCFILLTGIAFNVMLADGRPASDNFALNSVLMHIVLPILFCVDWILFYQHRQVKVTWPLFTLIPLTIYIAMIFFRASAFGFDSEHYILYPYFFLDLDKNGIVGVELWCCILAGAYTLFAYAMYGLDCLLRRWTKSREEKFPILP